MNSNQIKNPTKGYSQVNLVSNNQEKYNSLLENPLAVNSWGIVTRPAGFGGHFWINNTDTGTSMTYVGDVGGVPLFQDDLEVVDVPAPGNAPMDTVATPTGIAFSPHPTDFTITMPLDPDDPNSPEITGPGKFSFVTEDGTLSVWTENENPDGSFLRPVESIIVDDNSEFAPHNNDGDSTNDYVAIYKGVAVSTEEEDNKLYAADFGADAGIYAWDENFNDITSTLGFENPFNASYAPFNIQGLEDSLYVTYARSSDVAGEEVAGLGLGGVAEFDYDGNLIATYGENPEAAGNLLNAPWGLAIAPDDFGEFSNALLVANFGDGTIVGFDRDTQEEIGYLLDDSGNPLEVDGIWGMIFGNGASLGETNNLYFAAGPEDEADGLFGKLVPIDEPIEPTNGTENNDFLIGTSLSDILIGLKNDDRLEGNESDDILRGNRGEDTLNGNEGNDRLVGGFDDDFLEGGEGSDRLIGGPGNDILRGIDLSSTESNLGKGERDILVANRRMDSVGSDTFILGNESDVFYNDGDSSTRGGKDLARILGFNEADDTIQLSGSSDSYSLEFGSAEETTNATLIYNSESEAVGEVIARIIDVSPDLSLDDSAFTFV